VRDDVEDGVEVLGGLFLNGLDNLGVGVADVQHAHAADEVQELVAVQVFEQSAFAALDGNGVGGGAQCRGNNGISAGKQVLPLRSWDRFRHDFR